MMRENGETSSDNDNNSGMILMRLNKTRQQKSFLTAHGHHSERPF
jgi:hypothetical protein